MTNKEQNCQKELSWHCESIKNGGLQTNVEHNVITQLLGLLKKVSLFQCRVFDAAKLKALLTMKIMTNRLMLCGCVNLATNNDTKNQILMNQTEQAILAAWRLQQIQEGDTIDPIAARWIAETIELLKLLAKGK